MSNITISFENDDRTIEVDEDTIKKIPFLQSYCNFNNSVDKPNILHLENYSYEDCELVLDTVKNKKCNLMDMVKNELTKKFEMLDFFGVLSEDIVKLYMTRINDHLKMFRDNDIISLQQFVGNSNRKIIDYNLGIQFYSIISKHKHIVPYYNYMDYIFIGNVPIPVKISKECSLFSIESMTKDNFSSVKNLDGKVNKLFFFCFCLIFGLDDNKYLDMCNKKYAHDLYLLIKINYQTDKIIYISRELKKQSVQYILDNYKYLSSPSYLFNGSNIELVCQFMRYYRQLRYNCKLKDDSSFFMSDEDYNIMNNRDKYINIIDENQSGGFSESGFIVID